MDLLPQFFAGHVATRLTSRTFSVVFSRLTEGEKQRLATSGATELLLRCFTPTWEIVSVALSHYVAFPASRFFAIYTDDPESFYPEAVAPGFERFLAVSPAVYRDYEWSTRRKLPFPLLVAPRVLPDYQGSVHGAAIPAGQPMMRPVKVGEFSSGECAAAFLARFSITVNPAEISIPWTLDDLGPQDSIVHRVLHIYAGALEWFGLERSPDLSTYFYSGLYDHDGFSDNLKKVLAQTGFIEAFMFANKAAIPFEWRTVAGSISYYTDEAPSAIMLRNSPETFAKDAVIHFDEDVAPIESSEWLVEQVIAQTKSIYDDFKAVREHQAVKNDLDTIVHLVEAREPDDQPGPSPFWQLRLEHKTQIAQLLPHLKTVLCEIYQ